VGELAYSAALSIPLDNDWVGAEPGGKRIKKREEKDEGGDHCMHPSF